MAMTVAMASARFWVSVNSVSIAAMSSELSSAPAACLTRWRFDEAHRHAVHQGRREPREQPLSVRDPRLHQQRLVLLDGPQDVARQPVGVVGLAALGVQEVVAPDESADRALVKDRRFDRGGAYRQHADAARHRLGSQRQRQSDDGVLGHHVTGDLACRAQPGHGCGVDDVAVALPDHQRVGGRDAVHDAADVDVDDRVPLVQRQQLGVAAPHDPGVVEHQVQPARAAHHLVDRGLHCRRVGDVKACRPGMRAQLRRRRLGGVPVDVGADHIRARRHQRAAQRGADARACAGDNGVLTRETHCAASFITWPITSG